MGLLMRRGGRLPQFQWRPQKFETGQSITLPAPFAGLNLRDDITALQRNEARVLTNMFPSNGQLSVRDGSTVHANGMSLDGEVKTLVAFVGFTTSKLLAAAATRIYDVTSATETEDANDTYTKVLMQFDGADASTTAIDTNAGGSAHTWTAAGNAQLDTAQSKFGGSSGLFDGTGDYWSTPDHADFTVGSGAFTVDCWFQVNAAGGTQLRICGQADNVPTATTRTIEIDRITTNVMRGIVFVGGSSFIVNGTTQFTSTVNTGWHHAAFVRTGDTLQLFIDGVQEGSNVAISGSVNDSSNNLSIGRTGDTAAAEWNGWIDEFRLSVGVARWTAQYVNGNDANTKVLLHFNGPDAATVFGDDNSGGNAHAWTAAANAQIDTAQSKFGGASGLFDGTGDFVSTPDHADFTLGSSDFTIDAWFNCNAASGGTSPAIAGQDDGSFTVGVASWLLRRETSNLFAFYSRAFGGSALLTGRTQFSSTLNTGWHHIAVTRQGSTWRLYIDGLVESQVTDTSTMVDSAETLQVGSRGGTDNWNGWIDEFRLSVGIDRYSTADAPDSFTRVLLHMNGADASTLFPNHGAVANTWTAAGNAQVDTAQSKFGGASLLCDGTGDWIATPDSANFTIGSSDFTVDFWFNCNAASGTLERLAGQNDGTAAASAWRVYRTTGDVIQFDLSDGSAFTSLTSTTTFTSTGWHHLAFVRQGNTLRLFINGVQEASTASFTGTVPDSAEALTVGTDDDAVATDNWTGWIDEFRFSVGVARWSADFTPPTTAYNQGFTVPSAAYGGASFTPPDSAYAPTRLAGGFTSDLWQTALYSNTLHFVNGVDTPQVYNGSTVAAIAWTGSGLTNTNLVNVALVRNRLWFCENNSADVWYAGIGQVTAASALSKFQLSQIAGGGICMAIGSWSREDAGSGADDFTVFVMSTGEIIVYQGDPTTTFAQVGKYSGAPPIGRQCMFKVGGELIVITRLGFLPVGAAISMPPGQALDLSSINPWGKIAPGIVSDAVAGASTTGWNGTVHLGTVVTNVPLGSTLSKQYVLNTRIASWCNYDSLNASCWCSFNNDLYFGGKAGGKVVKMGAGVATDDGTAITVHVSQAFVYPNKTQFTNVYTAARPHFETEGTITGLIGVNTDFVIAALTGETVDFTPQSSSSGSLWDVAEWDVAEWGAEEAASDPRWFSITGDGKSVGIRLQLTSQTTIFRWYSTDLLYKMGGIKG